MKIKTVFRLFLLNILVAVYVFGMSMSLSAQDNVIEIDPIWEDGKLLMAKLNQDPFSEGLTSYINDFEVLNDEMQDWIYKAELYKKNEYVPYTRELQRYEKEVKKYERKCSRPTDDPNLQSWCQQSYAHLTDWKNNILDPMYKQHLESAAEQNKWGADLKNREEEAVKNAEDILDDTEKAFWLLAKVKSKEARANTISDCEALAQLVEALGQKVSYDLDEMVTMMGRVLAGGVAFDSVSMVSSGRYAPPFFADKGFRSQYVVAYKDVSRRNQVRHFVGYFIFGVQNYNNSLFSEIIARTLDGHEAGDYELGVVAANLGKEMAANPRLLRGLGGAIRNTIGYQ